MWYTDCPKVVVRTSGNFLYIKIYISILYIILKLSKRAFRWTLTQIAIFQTLFNPLWKTVETSIGPFFVRMRYRVSNNCLFHVDTLAQKWHSCIHKWGCNLSLIQLARPWNNEHFWGRDSTDCHELTFCLSTLHGMITLVSFYKYNKIIRKRLCLLCFLLTRRLHFKSLENVKFVYCVCYFDYDSCIHKWGCNLSLVQLARPWNNGHFLGRDSTDCHELTICLSPISWW
jgi:hypothetical protein